MADERWWKIEQDGLGLVVSGPPPSDAEERSGGIKVVPASTLEAVQAELRETEEANRSLARMRDEALMGTLSESEASAIHAAEQRGVEKGLEGYEAASAREAEEAVRAEAAESRCRELEEKLKRWEKGFGGRDAEAEKWYRRSLRLEEALRGIAVWCESEAIEAAADMSAVTGALRASGRAETFNRIEAKINALFSARSALQQEEADRG